jgi:2-keto-4-pentenoate hydratase
VNITSQFRSVRENKKAPLCELKIDSLDDAYRIQKSNIGKLGVVAAWKLGGTTLATRNAFNTTKTYLGPIFDGAVFKSMELDKVSYPRGTPKGEVEIYFRLNHYALTYAEETFEEARVLECISGFGLCVEFPWSVFELPREGLSILVADCCASGSLAIGPTMPKEQYLKLSKLETVSLSSNSKLIAEAPISTIVDGPLSALHDFLLLVSEYQLPIENGQLVATGGITPCVDLPIETRINVASSDPTSLPEFTFCVKENEMKTNND